MVCFFSVNPTVLEDPAHCIRITCLIRVTAWRSPVIYGPVSRVPTPPMGWGGVWCPCGGVYTYIHTYIPTYLPTYLRTYIHTYHYITLPYITLPYITLPYIPYIHTYITYIHTYTDTHTYIHTYLHTYIPTYQHTNIPPPQATGGGTRRTIPPPQATGGGDQKNQTILATHTHWWGGEGGGQRCTIYREKTGRKSETSEGLPQRRHPATWQMRLLRANRKKSRNRKQHGLAACIHVHWFFCHLHVHNCCSWMCLLSSYWYSIMYIHPSYQIKSNLAKSALACQKNSLF